MALSIDHHVHYCCLFDMAQDQNGEAKWSDIPYAIRRWIANRAEKNPAFNGRWFFAGGQWKPTGDNRFSIQTARSIGNGSENAPQFWSIRYEHADDEDLARQWRTDMGLTLSENHRITVSLRTIHWIQPGFIGKEPEPPLPTAPGIVGLLLNLNHWRAYAGSAHLVQTAKEVREGYAHLFRDEIFNPSRQVPIILISKQFSTGKPLLDSSKLARLLAGAAVVYESENSMIDKELEYLLDPEYRCWNGKVRVYQTGANSERWNDSKRHRYFTPEEIHSIGDSAIVEILVRGIVRRPQFRFRAVVTSLEDVEAKRQEEHLAALRTTVPSKDEWIKILEADNQRLSDELASKRSEAEQWYAEAERLQTVEEDNRILEFRNRTLSDETAQAKQRATLLETQAAVLIDLENFPNSVRDVVELVKQTFPSRVKFTARAENDADKCRLRDPSAAWHCLKSIATHLHRLHFEENLPMREIIKQFQNLVPFELAVTESETTRNNKKLMKQRKAIYKGLERDFTSHVKFGRDPGNSLRVHYFADDEDKLIVIDRCGDHLDLMSTN